jgi:hypothetical protein
VALAGPPPLSPLALSSPCGILVWFGLWPKNTWLRAEKEIELLTQLFSIRRRRRRRHSSFVPRRRSACGLYSIARCFHSPFFSLPPLLPMMFVLGARARGYQAARVSAEAYLLSGPLFFSDVYSLPSLILSPTFYLNSPLLLRSAS